MDLAPRYTLSTLFTLFNILHICQTVALCLYTLLGDVRALLEWAVRLLSNILDGLDG